MLTAYIFYIQNKRQGAMVIVLISRLICATYIIRVCIQMGRMAKGANQGI